MDSRARGRLIAKIEVRDATAGVGDFRGQLREALGRFALPSAGTDEFLDKLVGWWERRAVDLLLRRRSFVSQEEVLEEVRRLRDQYGAATLPAPDPGLAAELGQVLIEAYAEAPFVRQLELIAMRDERVQLAVRDYHRAYAQRSRWLEQGVLGPWELQEWEDRLFDEWEHAWQRMLDALSNPADEPTQATAGNRLYGDMEQSSLNPLRDGRDRFLHVGTLNGMADICRINSRASYCNDHHKMHQAGCSSSPCRAVLSVPPDDNRHHCSTFAHDRIRDGADPRDVCRRAAGRRRTRYRRSTRRR